MANRTNPVLKVARGILSTSKELQSLEQELASKLNLSNPKSPTARDQELLEITERRFELNKEINPILKEVHPLSRQKTFTKEEADRLDELQTRRDEIFATLKDMPDLGYTQKEWDRISDEDKKQTLGRPGISIELKVIRARIALEELEVELSKVQKDIGSEFKKEIKTKVGHFPITIDDVLNNEKEFEDTRLKGSDDSKEISKIERAMQRVIKDIDFIESGKAQAERDEIIRERKALGKSMGRPFEPLSYKLKKLKEKKAKMKKDIEAIEKRLPPYEQIGRKISVARKDLREQLKLVEDSGLDIKSDASHPLVEEYRRKELILKNFADERASFKKKGPTADVFAGFEFETPVKAKAQEAVSQTTSEVSHSEKDKTAIKEQMLAKARIKAKMKMKAKMLMKKKAKIANDEEKSEVQSDKDALRSIIG